LCSNHIIVYYKKDLVFKTKFKNYFILDFSLINNTLRKVFPLFINEFANSFALVLIFQIFSLSGKSAVSAITITDVVSQMVFIFANGLGTATSILVGYKLGQNDLDGAEENANYLLGYSLIVGIVILVVLSIAGFVVPQFYNISGYTRQVTTYTILIQALFAPMLILTRIFFFILRSGGRVREVVLINGLFMWVVKVPLAVILGFVFKVDIIILFFAVEATRVLNTLICIYYYKQKKWRINLTLESKNSSRG
jgi:Na+-driven multidrug efflux pump